MGNGILDSKRFVSLEQRVRELEEAMTGLEAWAWRVAFSVTSQWAYNRGALDGEPQWGRWTAWLGSAIANIAMVREQLLNPYFVLDWLRGDLRLPK
jgi:hypothetical protein